MARGSNREGCDAAECALRAARVNRSQRSVVASVHCVEERPCLNALDLAEDDAVWSVSAKLLIPIHYGYHDPQSYLEHPNALGELEETARARASSHSGS